MTPDGGTAGGTGGGKDEEREPVGSVAEEAAKLFSAVSDWARENGGGYADAASGMAAGAASTVGAVNEHIATGGRDCRYCPVCQAIAAVRTTSPEVKQHLASAATSLMQALSSAMATEVDPEARRRPGTTAERIDLSDDAWDED